MSKLFDVLEKPSNQKELRVFEAMLPAFEDAVIYSEKGDWANEVKAVQAALKAATSIAALRGTGWFLNVRGTLMSQGLLFRGAEPIGDIVPESGLEAMSRKNSMLAGLENSGLPISIWTDRVICGEKVVAVDEFTIASVFVDGVDQITQRPTLTRMALLSPLPGGALIPGLALQKKNRNDMRDVTFSIASADWQFTTKISTTKIQEAKSIAERVNAIASRLEKSSPNEPGKITGSSSVADELSKLKRLLDDGVLDETEFAELKAKAIKG